VRDDAFDRPHNVEFRFPADGAYVAILRTVTAGLAARCQLTVDEIEDLRIAVDEACALLLPHAAADAALTTRFVLHTGRVEFVATLPSESNAEPDRTGFAWTVLRALADDAQVSAADGVLSIALTKRRVTS
jgi:serine/threonine-protein kinase RsbW